MLRHYSSLRPSGQEVSTRVGPSLFVPTPTTVFRGIVVETSPRVRGPETTHFALQ